MNQASAPLLQLSWLLAAGAACSRSPPSVTPASPRLAVVESLYADLRAIHDRVDVANEAGRTGAHVRALILNHDALRKQVAAHLATIDSSALSREDTRALGVMRRTLAQDLNPLGLPSAARPARAEARPDCTYDAALVARAPTGFDSLRQRIYTCYSWSQSHVAFQDHTLDRLTILGALGRTEDSLQRRQLFLALEPVWRSMNADGGPSSPYRQLIAREVKERRGTEPPAVAQARASGVPPDSLERWLLAVLETWRAGNPDSLVEPWDWYYRVGLTSRRLSPLISRERLSALNAKIYRSLGADIEALRVRYDLDPREGKTPVAYTTFGGRPRFTNDAWQRGEPWVFATYRTGGLDNLNELLHETGHAVHIAAIRTRPAFADWPDSDPFTEAVADFVALDVYEPAWQQRWLGDSVPLADGLRGRYGGIALDVAWALFEMQMQRNPRADPNEIWTTLTRDYLRIRPHPELSWWAMRGQLVDAPGYMVNYPVGSILIAAIRARTRELHGEFVSGDSTWYRWVGPRLFRFGLERPTRMVVEEFLGRPVSPGALLEDMRRMRHARPDRH